MRNGLERITGAPLELIDHGGDIAAFHRLLGLEASGWKGRRGSAISMRRALKEWHLAAFELFQAQGQCSVLELRAGEVTLFMSYVLISGRTGFGAFDAYNETFATYNPGVLGRVLEQQYLLQDLLDAFDPCIHPDRYPEANVLYPETRELANVLIAPRLPARSLLRARPALRGIRERVQSRQGSGR